MPTDLQATLDFIRGLRTNNNTEWFYAHRSDYEAARDAFERLTDTILAKFTPVMDVGNTRAKNAVHRINRDIRFSADKSPTNQK